MRVLKLEICLQFCLAKKWRRSDQSLLSIKVSQRPFSVRPPLGWH